MALAIEEGESERSGGEGMWKRGGGEAEFVPVIHNNLQALTRKEFCFSFDSIGLGRQDRHDSVFTLLKI